MRFGVLGHPVSHSLSPMMHAAAFRELKINATYERFDVPSEELPAFIQRVRKEKIDGLSVTIPHKVSIMDLLDGVEDSARQLGAVNTIFWRDGKLVGDNTDWHGAMTALAESIDSTGKSVVVLGTGGAARAMCYGLRQRDARELVVLGRDADKLAYFQHAFQAETDTFDHLSLYEPDIIVNTTSLGMHGASENESPVPMGWFQYRQPVVFDIVYTPRETVLLRDARAAGCRTVEGVGMFVWQGVAQLAKWLDREIPPAVVSVMRETVLAALRNK